MTPEEEAALQKDIKDVCDRVLVLEQTREAVKSGEEAMLANRRVRYQETGQWARHYSTVRMTVTTFLLGLSVSIVTFGWQYWDEKPRGSSVETAAALWLLAVSLFTVFTRLSLQMGVRATKHRRELKIENEKPVPDGQAPPQDAASWTIAAISLGFAQLLWWTKDLYWALGFLVLLVVLVLIARCLTEEKKSAAAP
jgi:magnesium-transporting ATPase (P-type)